MLSLRRGPGYVRFVTNCNNGLHQEHFSALLCVRRASCVAVNGKLFDCLPRTLLLINALHDPPLPEGLNHVDCAAQFCHVITASVV
jgi:hypothetical protein